MGEGACRKDARRRARLVDGELRCERCGVVVQFDNVKLWSIHHRRKRSQLPKVRHWEVSNCVVLCGDGVSGCHGWVEGNPDAAREEGWHVRSYEEPRMVPVKLWHTEFAVYLNDEGGFDSNPPVMDNG